MDGLTIHQLRQLPRHARGVARRGGITDAAHRLHDAHAFQSGNRLHRLHRGEQGGAPRGDAHGVARAQRRLEVVGGGRAEIAEHRALVVRGGVDDQREFQAVPLLETVLQVRVRTRRRRHGDPHDAPVLRLLQQARDLRLRQIQARRDLRLPYALQVVQPGHVRHHPQFLADDRHGTPLLANQPCIDIRTGRRDPTKRSRPAFKESCGDGPCRYGPCARVQKRSGARSGSGEPGSTSRFWFFRASAFESAVASQVTSFAGSLPVSRYVVTVPSVHALPLG